ncbi:MAG: type II secretion system minor pseudopilin GspK [Gammaproteobacteria bacterium]|nr:type II secretion system minor pseudopilin GspK [Gammaproteobacteria bacterium]
MPSPERTVRRFRRAAPSRGVALVSVLLIVALASALAYQMLSRHGLTIAHSEQLLRGGQAREYALAAEAFARQLLAEDWSDEETRAADTLLEPWAEPSPPFEIEDGEIVLAIVDLNARFNLNGVIGKGGPDNVERLKQLVANLELEPVIADTWVDWVDPDSDVNAAGAEDETYLLSVPAYRAANQPAASTSELLAVRDVTPADYAALRPHVAWLPETGLRVNVNTAGYEVLRSLAPGLSEEEAETLIESDREFQEVAEATAQHAALGNSVAAIAVMSEYFEVRIRAELEDTQVTLASMLHRDPTTGRVRLLARDFGRDFRPVDPPAGENDDAYADDAPAVR